MKNKKAQAAMEFLMTYGWALLVVLIVIAALAFFGLLNPSRFLPERCDIGPGLTCVDYYGTGVSNYQNVTIILNNGIGQIMRDSNISLSVCDEAGANNGTFAYGNIGIGESVSITINCTAAVPGSRFKSDIQLNYSTLVEGNSIPHVKSGFMVVEIQEQ